MKTGTKLTRPDEVTREDCLNYIDMANGMLSDARVELDSAVSHARAMGVTWREIGEVLGVGRAAAYDRFGGRR